MYLKEEFESDTPKCGFSYGGTDSAPPPLNGKQGPWAIGLSSRYYQYPKLWV